MQAVDRKKEIPLKMTLPYIQRILAIINLNPFTFIGLDY